MKGSPELYKLTGFGFAASAPVTLASSTFFPLPFFAISLVGAGALLALATTFPTTSREFPSW